MHFYKMHGTGNDFVLIENLREESFDYPLIAKALCKPHFGIGADSLIVILPSRKADFKMRIFNADGSEAEMCGNGIRCFARHVCEKGLTSKKSFQVETLSGLVEPICQIDGNGRVEKIRVNMGNPRYGDLHPKAGQPLRLRAENLLSKLKLPEGTVPGATISMGNPHFVVFADKNVPWNLEKHGKNLSMHASHPHQSNIEFVEISGPDMIRVQVWERGVGPTNACGSGACASVAALRILKNFPEKINVEMPGGVLEVEWDGENAIFLSGPAAYVYEGEVAAELLTGLTTAQEKLSGLR